MWVLVWIVVIVWGLIISIIVLHTITNYYSSKRLKEKENVEEKECNEEEVERLLRILERKEQEEKEWSESWLKAEEGNDKEIDEYERSRKVKLEKIKVKYNRLEKAAEQDYLSHIERLNRMRENENKDN